MKQIEEEEEGPKKARKRRRLKLAGSSRVDVPYKLYAPVLIALIGAILFSVDGADEATEKRVQPPTRPLSAETILLKDGSTTFISSLEDYLSRSTILPESITNGSNDELMDKQENLPSNRTDNNKMRSLMDELEREEVTSSSPVPTSTTGEPHRETAAINPEPQQRAHGHHHGASSANSSQKGKILQHYEVRGLLNVTNDYPLAYSQVICGYVWPLMAAITLFTNLMIVFVLTQNDMRTPTNVVLTAIAIADIIPIVVPVPWFVYLFAMGNEKQVLYPPVACYFYQHSTRSVSEVFYFLSTWLNVLLAVQDYLTACWPHLAKKYCQIRVVVIEVISLTVLAFLLNLPQAVKLVFKPVKFFYNGQLTNGCKAIQARWFKDLIGEYAALYDDVFTAIIVIFVDGGPAIALVTLTWLLIRQLQRQRIQGHLLMEQARTASKRRRERHRQQEYEASARVMIFVLLAFLAVKMPFATTYTLMIIQSRFEIHFMESLNDFQKALTLIDLVFVLSYPLNFTIFCCCSKKFRHKCAELLGECDNNTKAAKSRLMHSISGSLNSEMLSIAHGNYKRDSVATLASQQPRNSVALPTTIANSFGHSTEDLAAANNWDHHRQSTVSDLLGPSRRASGNYRLDKICDGRNHFDRPPIGVVQADLESAEFQALLDDGSLCFECIMRYEQMRGQWQLQSKQGIISADQTRRTSDESSTSWPVCPPPPPPIHNAHLYQHLPQIVTTRCDSIRERPNSEEADLVPDGDCVVGDNPRGARGSLPESGSGEHAQRPRQVTTDSIGSGEQGNVQARRGQTEQQPTMGARKSINQIHSKPEQARRSSGTSAIGSNSLASDHWRGSEEDTMRNLDFICRTRANSAASSTTDSQIMSNNHQEMNNLDRSTYNQRADHDDQIYSRIGAGLNEFSSSSPRAGSMRRRSERDHLMAGNRAAGDEAFGGGRHERMEPERRTSDRPPSRFERERLQDYHASSEGRQSSRDTHSSERLCSSQGHNERHAPALAEQMNEKQRSMSMSNSKLSALASATGLLAGAIKSHLLTTDPRANQQRPSSSAGRLARADWLHK